MATLTRRSKVRGRRAGGGNRGYYFRSGAGCWYLTNGGPLLDGSGNKITDRKTADSLLRAAYEAHRFTEQLAEQEAAKSGPVNAVPILEVVGEYLDHLLRQQPASYAIRRPMLADFAKFTTGRILATLTPLDIEKWLATHPGWAATGKGRMAIQAVKAAINWAVAVKMATVSLNPIKGLRVEQANCRKTFFTEATEAKMILGSKADFRLAIRVMILTGARPYCEFAALRAENVKNYPTHQEWVWRNGTKVKGKERTIIVTCPKLIATVNELCRQFKSGPIFRTAMGAPWTEEGLKSRWHSLRNAMRRKGHKFEKDDCIYSFRHTYAKRMLGAGVSLEKLSELMGNTMEVCRKHYGQWVGNYKDPLLDAVRLIQKL